MRALGLAVLTALVLLPAEVRAVPYDERPAWQRAGFTAYAVVANIVPLAPTLVVPKCLPGYVFCKFAYASLSVVGAAESLFMSGDQDVPMAEAILHRGFGGDWFLTGRNMAGDVEPNVLPDPGPPNSGGRDLPPEP